MNNKKEFFAEVIESSLDGWTAQSWDWDKSPSFGSIVVIENDKRKLFGIVHQIRTGSNDPVRAPFAYQKTEEELLKEQPQIFEFLKTNFSCLNLGYKENSKIFHMLAPEPPKIHSFVRKITAQESLELFKNSQYLQVLFGYANKISNLDELLLSLIKHLSENSILNDKHFEEFIETYSLLTDNDYRRLKLFLQRVNLISQI